MTIRLDDDTRTRVSSTELPDRDCQNLVVVISREGSLSILTDVVGNCLDDDSEDDAA